ncbi:MAG TPA: DUF1573 domain-containing protein [Bacteroidales bacterium]|nr:DUF1573 domain-containing protein [Bacteroidales bacterium]
MPAINNMVSMRHFINFFCVAALLLTGCSQTSHKSSMSSTGAAIEFETIEHDFGTIPFKGDGTYEFVFKSKGEEPLVLKNVKSSCGCTIPEWPKEPISKGKKGTIKVVYNTRVTGSFSKSISVSSNASESPIVLVIKGRVEEEKKDMSAAPALE